MARRKAAWRRLWIPAATLAIAAAWYLFVVHFDRGYPIRDGQWYLQESQDIYRHFLESGSIAGTVIHAAVRLTWKPILHPAVGAIFLALFKGDVHSAVQFQDCFYLLAITLASFLTASLYCLRWQSGLIALAVAFSSWTFLSLGQFMPEVPHLSAFLFASYFWLKSGLNPRSWDVFGFFIFAAIAILFRPVEGALTLFPLFASMLVQGIRRKTIRGPDLAFVIGVILLHIFLLLYSVWSPTVSSANFQQAPYRNMLRLIALSLTGAPLILRKIRIGPLTLGAGVGSHLVFSWFCARSMELLDWTWACSFGSLAAPVDPTLMPNYLDFWPRIAETAGNYPIVLAISAAGLIVWKLRTRQSIRIPPRAAYAAGLFLILLGSLSKNIDPRYFHSVLAYGLLLCWIVIAALLAPPKASRFRPLLVALALVFSVSASAWSAHLDRRLYPAFKYGEVSERHADRLLPHLTNGNRLLFIIPEGPVLDLTQQIAVVAKSRRVDLYLGFTYDGDLKKPLLEEISQKYDYVCIKSPDEGQATDSPTLIMTRAIFKDCLRGQVCKTLGWRLIDQFEETRVELQGTYYVFQTRGNPR